MITGKFSIKGLLKGIVQALGSAAGGAIGGPVGAAVGYYVSGWFFDQMTDRRGDLPVSQLFEEWKDNKFEPWLNQIILPLKGSENRNVLLSAEYRNNVNKVIEALHVARLYYKSLGQAYKGTDTSEAQTRAEVCLIFAESIKAAYIKALQDEGVTANVEESTLIAHNVTTGVEPFYDWDGAKVETILERFVEPGTGSQPTTTAPGTETESPKTNLPTQPTLPIQPKGENPETGGTKEPGKDLGATENSFFTRALKTVAIGTSMFLAIRAIKFKSK